MKEIDYTMKNRSLMKKRFALVDGSVLEGYEAISHIDDYFVIVIDERKVFIAKHNVLWFSRVLE